MTRAEQVELALAPCYHTLDHSRGVVTTTDEGYLTLCGRRVTYRDMNWGGVGSDLPHCPVCFKGGK